MKFLKIFIVFIAACLLLVGLIRVINFYPEEMQAQKVVCTSKATLLKRNQKIKVMSWNVQYMAGRNYVFYYDETGGQDSRPSSKDINITTKRVAELIKQEDPDIILMQEVDDGAARTDYENQTTKLLKQLPPNKYPCRTEAFYWKSAFVPHPNVMGSVGMKLVTFSKYKIIESYRHSLPQIPKSWLEEQFYLKRGILEARLPYEGQKKSYFYVMNTHLSAFAQGTDNMKQQVSKILDIVSGLEIQKARWIIGGDFNLLPVSTQREGLGPIHREVYQEITELRPLVEKYQMIPTLEEVSGKEMHKWFTYSPNTPKKEKSVDRTIDYLFLSDNIQFGRHYLLIEEGLKISDHIPLVSFIKI